MLADPENYSPEDPIIVFDQLVQTVGVMMYTQSYISNIPISRGCLELAQKTLETRVRLAYKHYDFDKKEFAPNPFDLERQDLRKPDWRQLVHLKLILTSLTKNKRADKKHRSDEFSKEIADLAVKLVLNIHAPIPKSAKL